MGVWARMAAAAAAMGCAGAAFAVGSCPAGSVPMQGPQGVRCQQASVPAGQRRALPGSHGVTVAEPASKAGPLDLAGAKTGAAPSQVFPGASPEAVKAGLAARQGEGAKPAAQAGAEIGGRGQ